MTARASLAVGGLVVVMIAACGGPSDPGAASLPAAVPPVLDAAGEVLVSCGSDPPFAPSVIERGGAEVSEELEREIVEALADLKESDGIDAPEPLQGAEASDVDWVVIWSKESAATPEIGLMLDSTEVPGFALNDDPDVRLENLADGWVATGWGERCNAAPVLPEGFAWAEVSLGAPKPASSGRLDLLVSESDCTSARDPDPFLSAPTVVENSSSVTIYWTTEAMTGDATCPGNPWVERSVELDGPLGDRVLLDGSTEPPAVVGYMDER